MPKKNNKHETVGVDSEIQDLFSPADEAEEENPFLLPEKRENAKLPTEVESKDLVEDKKIDRDAEYARNNLWELIEHGMAAIQDMSHLSREQMHPRTYEVLSKLMKDVASNNLALLELANQKKAAKKKEEGSAGPQPVTNNIDKAIFVGTTSELLKAMNKAEE